MAAPEHVLCWLDDFSAGVFSLFEDLRHIRFVGHIVGDGERAKAGSIGPGVRVFSECFASVQA